MNCDIFINERIYDTIKLQLLRFQGFNLGACLYKGPPCTLENHPRESNKTTILYILISFCLFTLYFGYFAITTVSRFLFRSLLYKDPSCTLENNPRESNKMTILYIFVSLYLFCFFTLYFLLFCNSGKTYSTTITSFF